MDREAFGKKTSECQRPRNDRFIPLRSSIDVQKSKRVLHRLSHDGNHQKDWYQYSKYLHQKRYTSHIGEAFGLDVAKSPVPSNSTQRHGKLGTDCVKLWPCAPRKKRHLTSADSVLDLPNYQYALFPELLDWSSDDILVAALGRNYHTWSWRSQGLVNQGITLNLIFCCKFDPRGELLAIGTDYKVVEIHHKDTSKGLTLNHCPCLNTNFCSITAIDWSPTGNAFVTGCSRGTLVAFTRSAERISWRRVCRGEILFVRVSPNARLVACTAVDAQFVLVCDWPSLQPYSTVESECTVKSITWHPWSSALLAMGSVAPENVANIALLDVPRTEVRQVTVCPGPMTLDTMLFSHRTGELVMSLWNSDRSARTEGESGSRLVVMSDPDTVVDQWGEGSNYIDRIRTMVFSPDGTKLATATTDEDLIIWNFLPEDNKKKKWEKRDYQRRFSSLPVYLDETILGFSLR